MCVAPRVLRAQRRAGAGIQGELIGEGLFATFYFARDEATGELFVAKQVQRPRARYAGPSDAEASLINEMEIMKQLDHAHIVRCLGFEAQAPTMNLYVVLERSACPDPRQFYGVLAWWFRVRSGAQVRSA